MRYTLLFIFILSSSCVTYSQAFLPSDITGLTLWLSADSVNEVNGKVATWYDKSGNNNPALQADSTKQPILIQNTLELNNQPVVSFDGIKDYLQFTDINNIRTSFFVFDHNHVYRANDNLFGHTTNAAGSLLSGGLYKLIYYSANWLNIAFLNGRSISPYDLAQDSSYNIITLIPSSNGVANTVSHNGYGGYNPWHGNIAEILFYDKVLSNNERILIEEYLSNKYAPPVNLGSDINITYGFCDTVVAAGSNFTSYIWSTGDTTQTISVNKPGIYFVKTTNIFGFVSSDTLEVTYPSYSYINSDTICFGDSLTWNTGLSKTGYTFQWQDNSTDSFFVITKPGEYWVKITDTSGCFIISDTAVISVDSFSVIASLGPDTSFCSGNSIGLKQRYTPGLNYLWSDGSADSTLIINASGQYSVAVTNPNGCIARDTINVTITGTGPQAGFTALGFCKGNSTQFTDTSTAPSGESIVSWEWNFGGIGSSTLQNPSFTFPDTGSYIISLEVTSSNGCITTTSKTIEIYPTPLADFISTGSCGNEAIKFTDKSNTIGYPIISWGWNFGDAASGTNNTTNLQNPTHIFSATGAFAVNFTVINNQGCSDSATKNIALKPFPTVAFDSSIPCNGIPVQFTNKSTAPAGTTLTNTRSWNFDDPASGTNTSAVMNPIHLFSDTGLYNVSLIVNTSNGCKDTLISPIYVAPVPEADFGYIPACLNSPTSFFDSSTVVVGTIASWLWKFENTSSSVSSTEKNPQHTFEESGDYTISLKVTSNAGCSDSIDKSINIEPLPVAGFTFTPLYGSPGAEVSFTNTSENAESYQWQFGDRTQDSIKNPVHIYNDTGVYTVTLTAFYESCNSSTSKTLSIFTKRLDAGIISLRSITSNGFLQPITGIANFGTVVINTLDIIFNVNNGGLLKERWTGTLLPGEQLEYTFNASLSFNENNASYYCVNLINVNDTIDDNQLNNVMCKAIDENEFALYDIYPNPVTSVATIPFTVPFSQQVLIEIIDSKGALIQDYTPEAIKGINLFNAGINALSKGVYIVKIQAGENVLIKKFLKF